MQQSQGVWSVLLALTLSATRPTAGQNLPYAHGLSQSSGTNPSGSLNLANYANASYDPVNGFQASSNTQNVADGPFASIQSVAQANVYLGDQIDLSNAQFQGSGNAFSNGLLASGTVQDLNQAAGGYGNAVTGAAQSQVAGAGTGITLGSTANATASAQSGVFSNSGRAKATHVANRAVVNGYPYAQGSASSAGINPNGNVSLSNNVQSTFDQNNGFQAYANTQNIAAGQNASLQSSAATYSNSGSPGAGAWNVVGSGGALSLGNALTGTLQNQDTASGSSGNQVLGQGSSQIAGTGTQLALSSTANADASAQPVSNNVFTKGKSNQQRADVVHAARRERVNQLIPTGARKNVLQRKAAVHSGSGRNSLRHMLSSAQKVRPHILEVKSAVKVRTSRRNAVNVRVKQAHAA